MRAIRAARRLLELSWREIADFFRAQLAILVATWKLRRVRIGDLVTAGDEQARAFPVSHTGGGPTIAPDDVSPRAAQLAIASDRAARFGLLRPKCLVRSIALRNLLADRGIPGSIIRVGVRRKAGEFVAHAWVELDGRIIGDDVAEVARFTPLNSLGVRTTQ